MLYLNIANTIKKQFSVAIVFLCGIILFSTIYINNNLYIKTALYRFYYIQQERLHRKIANKFLGLPVPVNYINHDILNKKILNPASWVVSQIDKDFANFRDSSKDAVLRTFDLLPADKLLVLFTVNNGVLSVNKKHNAMNGSCERGVFIYSRIFEYLLKHGYITNVSFLLRLADFFSDPMPYTTADLAPILTTSKDLQRKIDQDLVLIPDYMSLEDIPKFMPRIRQANKIYPWNKKQHKIHWRGGYADVSGFRKSMVKYSIDYPESMIDAQFVVAKKDFVPPEFQLQSKFLLNIDGHTAAWTRPIWQLQSNSVMVKQNSALTQWYYDALIPDVHFIAVNSDPEAVIDKVNRYTDQELYNIAQGGSLFAENNLTIDDMVAYIALVLQKYEYLQNNK